MSTQSNHLTLHGVEVRGSQAMWSFGIDYPCRTCAYFHMWWEGEKLKCMCGCGARNVKRLAHIPLMSCKTWKKGVEVMAFIDFKKMSEKDLKDELEKIRSRRRGVGKKKRTQSVERRVKDAAKTQANKEAEANAEWI